MHFYPNDSVVKYRPRETFSPSPPLGRYEQLMSHFPQDLDNAGEPALDPVLRFLRPSCCPMVKTQLSAFSLMLTIEQFFLAAGVGGADRDRTGDPLLAKQVLSQLSYSPILD